MGDNNNKSPEEIERRKRNAEKSKRWRLNNPEKYRETKNKSVAKHIDRVREGKVKRHKSNPERHMLQQAKRRAIRNNLEFSITLEDVIIPSMCPVLGINLFVAGGIWTDNSPTLDRIDNNKGYIKGNVIVVSWRANRLKGDATIPELIRIAEFYRRFL